VSELNQKISSIDDVEKLLAGSGYVGDQEIATAIFLAIRLRRPLLVEGHAGVGKTEIAKVLTDALGTTLFRLQCYEGLDVSSTLYEWNYAKQILRIRMEENSAWAIDEKEAAIFSEPYLLARPLLQALRHHDRSPVLLIDEIDRADEEFEAFLLEVLSEYQVTIPELGTIRTSHPPYVVLTSNRIRELGDALKRRCLYLWIDYPSFEKEFQIVRMKVPGAGETMARQLCTFMQALRELNLDKRPGVAETLDWGLALCELGGDGLSMEKIKSSLGCVVKSRRDIERVQSALPGLLERSLAG
jgi:MoxR-like ATPase